MITILYITLLAVCTTASLLGMRALYKFVANQRPQLPVPSEFPPVSVLKPLKGVDDALKGNLESLFVQEYPNFELLFGIEGNTDPAILVVEHLMAKYPNVNSRLVLHNGGRGFNPKVANLRAIVETGTHDIVVISDSNIAVPNDYLINMVRQLSQPNVELVTSLFVGKEETNLPALMENMHLNGPVLNSLGLYESLMKEVLVVGKSNMFRRSVFDKLGGLESLAYVQAEDYFMGKMMKRAGYKVAFSHQLVTNVIRRNSFTGMLQRYLRWAIARSHMAPLLYPFELLINPLVLALAAPLFGMSIAWTLPWMLGLIILRDATQWYWLRGTEKLGHVVVLSPIRELLLTLVWICAPFSNIISWRGNRFHVGEGAHLFRKPSTSNGR